MSGSKGHLAVDPEKCDRCGKCVQACPQGKLRVGAGFIYVDLSACDGCFSCVAVCERQAIVRRVVPTKPTAHSARITPSEVGHVLVGSRAEAKALRKAAEAAEKERAKGASAKAEPKWAPVAEGGWLERWTLVEAVAVAAVLVVALMAKAAVLDARAVAVMPLNGRIAVRALVLGTFYGVQVGLLAWLCRRRGTTIRDAFGLRSQHGEAGKALSSAAVVVALLVATRALSTAWGALAQAAGWLPPRTETLTAVFGGGGAGVALSVLMVVLVAPVVEELAFRGVIARALVGRFGVWPGIVSSAAIFAAYHVTAWVLVPTFVLGLALGWLAVTRKGLWPAIALHALYNGVVVGVAFWLPALGQ